MLAIQYLEPGPHIEGIRPQAAAERLEEACRRLPLTDLILGWDLPQPLLEACASQAQKSGLRLWLWHPLLSAQGLAHLLPGCQVLGLAGAPIGGAAPEFTFLCPNRVEVQAAGMERLERALDCGAYQGVFLDRIRWPSAATGAASLGCFCSACREKAAAGGLDLDAAEKRIRRLLEQPDGVREAVRLLLEPDGGSLLGDAAALKDLLDFRCASITRSVKAAAGLVRRHGLALGLDCFSPALAGLVGQDLASLCLWGDWVKIMTYAHTHAPAGLPYELRGLLNWLCGPGEMQEQAALEYLARSSRLALPESRQALAEKGLPPEDLALEVRRARAMGVEQVLAGIELVELEGVTRLSAEQAAADLQALHAAGPHGLVLSWDLWRMPLEHLDWILNFYNLT